MSALFDPKHRSWLIWGILAAALAAAVAILNPPWCDEVAYLDPGARLALFGSFTSTAWVSNSPETFWASSNPGMPLLFAGWFKVFGFGLLQARTLLCLLHFLGALVFITALYRRLRCGPGVLFVVWLACLWLPSLANSIFQPRLEVFALLFCGIFLFSIEPSRSRLGQVLLAFLLGLACAFIGLHFSGFFALMSLVAWGVQRNLNSFLRGLALAVGTLLGVFILYLVYRGLHVWDIFVEARASHYGRDLAWVPKGWKMFAVTKDLPVFAGLAATFAFLAWRRPRDGNPSARFFWLTALAAFLLIPPSISVIGIYYGNYSWMVAVPMLLAFAHGWEGLAANHRRYFRAFLILSLIVAIWDAASRIPRYYRLKAWSSDAGTVVRKTLPAGAPLAADFCFYYDVVSPERAVYFRVRKDEGLCLGFTQDRYCPPSLRKSIDWVLAMGVESAHEMTDSLGGDWVLAATLAPPPGVRNPHNILLYRRAQ